jgi:predicted SprT family Zn-dependent metalloprotease
MDVVTQSALSTLGYGKFQQAYDWFNEKLFDGTLPSVLITLQRGGRTSGYFSYKRFSHRIGENSIHEIALNPAHFSNYSDTAILAILVHESCHAWQWVHGKPSRTGYHNHQWANKMKSVGLYPSSTGQPHGKETGQHMSHYIVLDDPFSRACRELIDSGFKLSWQSLEPVADKKPTQTRAKFTCSECGQSAWAKPDAQLICGVCRSAQIDPAALSRVKQLLVRSLTDLDATKTVTKTAIKMALETLVTSLHCTFLVRTA